MPNANLPPHPTQCPHPPYNLHCPRSLRALSREEFAATTCILHALEAHLGGLVGDLRPHVITNVGLTRRTGVLMKESLMEVVQPKDRCERAAGPGEVGQPTDR